MFQKEKATKKNITLGEHYAAALDEICKTFQTTNREVIETALRNVPQFMEVYNNIKNAVMIDTDAVYLKGDENSGEK